MAGAEDAGLKGQSPAGWGGYGGHDPCECGDNLRWCQFWDMQGCTPD
jgi:hypothetical protein